jgi:hypothetical protein
VTSNGIVCYSRFRFQSEVVMVIFVWEIMCNILRSIFMSISNFFISMFQFSNEKLVYFEIRVWASYRFIATRLRFSLSEFEHCR